MGWQGDRIGPLITLKINFFHFLKILFSLLILCTIIHTSLLCIFRALIPMVTFKVLHVWMCVVITVQNGSNELLIRCIVAHAVLTASLLPLAVLLITCPVYDHFLYILFLGHLISSFRPSSKLYFKDSKNYLSLGGLSPFPSVAFHWSISASPVCPLECLGSNSGKIHLKLDLP